MRAKNTCCLAVLLIGMWLAGVTSPSARSVAAFSDLPCDGWTLHTRTLPGICPEVVIEGLSGQGVTAVGAIAFDSDGALYITRPGIGEVLRLSPDSQHAARFLPPETIAAGLDFPYGLACVHSGCYVTTAATIVRLTDKALIVSDLAKFVVHPLHIDRDRRLWTANGKALISVALDGTDERVSTNWNHSIVDFGWSSTGKIWASDGDSRVWPEATTARSTPIDLAPNSAPAGLTFYPDQPSSAFPQFANGLLLVTSGSWNTIVLTGYELWFVPFMAGQPGIPQALIPANTDRSHSDAALYLLTFFPDHPLAVSVSSEGWLYVATREGRIVRLRPRVS